MSPPTKARPRPKKSAQPSPKASPPKPQVPPEKHHWLTSQDLAGLPCDKRVQLALLGYPQDWRLPRATLAGCYGGTLAARPEEGSQNWPPMAHMYSVLTHQEDPEKLLPYFNGEGGWGLGGSEGTSMIYGAWPWVAALLLYPHLRGKPRGACRRWLRAVVARLALSAREGVPASVRFRFGEQRYRVSRRPAGAYGPPVMVHAPGERSATWDGWWIRRSQLHALFSGALGASWRPWRPLREPRYPYPEPPPTDWPAQLANWHLGGRLAQRSPAAPWGLSESERRALRRFIITPSPRHAAPLLRWLQRYKNLPGLTSTWLYFDSGARVALSHRSASHEKSGQGAVLLAAVRGDGQLAWRESATSPAQSRQPSYAELAGTAIRLHSEVGPSLEFPLRRFGRLRFRVVHDEEGVQAIEA